MFFYICKGKNAAKAAKKLLDVYGEEALKDRQWRNWFDKFRSRDFSLKDEKRSGQPNEVDDDQIKAIIQTDRHVTVQKIEKMSKIPTFLKWITTGDEKWIVYNNVVRKR